jgi:type IV pilus assembly protein PilA
MKKHISLKSKFNSAFSLVELLVVVAVIAVIAAIAIPNIANVVGQSEEAVQQKNAQSLVNTWNNYVAALQQSDRGSYDALGDATIATAVATLQGEGVRLDTNGDGTLDSQPFAMGGITVADILPGAVIEGASGVKTLGYNPNP